MPEERPIGPSRYDSRTWDWQEHCWKNPDTLEEQAKYVMDGIEDELVGIHHLETRETDGASQYRDVRRV